MTLAHQYLMIGNKDSFLDSVPKVKIEQTHFIGIFGILSSINRSLQKYNTSLECICNINEINNKAFSDYKILKLSKYNVNGISNLGFGNYFHLANDEKIALISSEYVMMDYNANFNIEHPVKRILPEFSSFLNYNPNESLDSDKIAKFPYIKYLKGFNDVNNYKIKLCGIFGHVHKNKNEIININNDNLTPLDDSSDINTNILRKDLVNDSEFFIRENSEIKNLKIISEFVNIFRKVNQNHLSSEYPSGFDYSHMIIKQGEKYFFYSEATSLGVSYELVDKLINHHDRLGFFLELTPSKKGVSNNKISLVSYMESINSLLRFKTQINEYNSKEFISNFSNDLESALK